MQCSRLLYPFAWLPRRAKHHGQKVTRLSDFENGQGKFRVRVRIRVRVGLWL